VTVARMEELVIKDAQLPVLLDRRETIDLICSL